MFFARYKYPPYQATCQPVNGHPLHTPCKYLYNIPRLSNTLPLWPVRPPFETLCKRKVSHEKTTASGIPI